MAALIVNFKPRLIEKYGQKLSRQSRHGKGETWVRLIAAKRRNACPVSSDILQ